MMTACLLFAPVMPSVSSSKSYPFSNAEADSTFGIMSASAVRRFTDQANWLHGLHQRSAVRI